MEAVSNATVLISLAQINRMDLLWNVYYKVFVTNSVKDEVLAKDSTLSGEFSKIKVKDPKRNIDFKLDRGESDAIALCLDIGIKDFLSDDKRARTAAKLLKLKRVGTIGILLWNLKKGFISKNECSELLEELMKKHYRISTQLYAAVRGLIEKK